MQFVSKGLNQSHIRMMLVFLLGLSITKILFFIIFIRE